MTSPASSIWTAGRTVGLAWRTPSATWGCGPSCFSAVSLHELGDDQPSPALCEFLLRVDGEHPGFERKLLGTWACMRSHLGVIAHARDNGWPAVLIMEDDCEFEPYTLAVLERVASQLQGLDWDLLYLGGTFKKGGEKRKVAPNLLSVTRMRLTHATWSGRRFTSGFSPRRPCRGCRSTGTTPRCCCRRSGD